MITRVWGNCNGDDLICRCDSGEQWETTVPACEDGYVVSLYAEDDAGNVGYFATVRYKYDTTQMCMKAIVLDVGTTFSLQDVQAAFGDDIRVAFAMQEVCTELSPDHILSDDIMVEVDADLCPDHVVSKIVRCEVCKR